MRLRGRIRQGQEAWPADHAAFVILAIDGLAATGGNPGHQRQAREVVAGQEALAGQVAIGVEVVVLAVAGLEQHSVLARGVAVTALGILALSVRGGMALDDAISHIHLLAGGIEQHAPAPRAPENACAALSMTWRT